MTASHNIDLYIVLVGYLLLAYHCLFAIDFALQEPRVTIRPGTWREG